MKAAVIFETMHGSGRHRATRTDQSLVSLATADAAMSITPRLRRRQLSALAAPPVLIVSTYIAFQVFTDWFGPRWGYIGGFVFFWAVWCFGFSLWAIGPGGVAAVLRSSRPRFPRPAALWLALLVIPVVGGLVTRLLPELAGATIAVLGMALLIAVLNAIAEELLWRGVYIRLFPGRMVAGWLYPAVFFALWHVSPTSVRGSALVLVPTAAFLGLLYGWIAQKTGTIRYTVIAHALVNAMGLGFALLVLQG
jgi:uncharacterized protein